MGVSGLETFMKNNNSHCIKNCNIGKLARLYKKRHGKKSEIVIDLNSCLFKIYGAHKPWISGGQLKEFAHSLQKFLEKFLSFDIKLTVFLDGFVHPQRHQKWLTNRQNQRKNINSLFHKLDSNQCTCKSILYPSNIRDTLISVLKEYGVTVYQSIMECDVEMALYARKHKCFGILAQDSDFVIFNAADYYFSINKLNMKTLDTDAFMTDGLIQLLNLELDKLPLFATLVGNGYLPVGALKKFHSLLGSTQKGNLIFKVAQFIRDYFYGLATNRFVDELLSLKCFGLPEVEVIQHSLNFYDLNFPHEENTLICGSHFERKVVELHRSTEIPRFVFNVLIHKQYFQQVWLQDPRKTVENKIAFKILENLRRKIYGIIFQRDPHIEINEYFVDVDAKKNICKIKPSIPKHGFDFIKILTSSNDDKNLHEEKNNLFFSTLNLMKDKNLFSVGRHLWIPVLAVQHLMMEGYEIRGWELDAVIATMVLVKKYSIEDISSIQEHPMDSGGVHLYWLVVEMFEKVALLNSVCGSPIEPQFTRPSLYQDGLLFHHKYKQAKNKVDLKKLCQFKEEYKSAIKIKDVILNRNGLRTD